MRMDAPTPAEPAAPRRRLLPPLRAETVGDPQRGPRFLGYAADLSSTGLFLQSTYPRDPGTRFKLKLHLRGRQVRPLYAEVEVRWCRGYSGLPGPSPGMGVVFLDLGRRERRLLSRVLADDEVVMRYPEQRQS
jgi:hypothetical protein